MPYGAIRSGNYRLVEFFDDMHTELYDLAADIGEQHDLTATLPDKSNELRAKLHAWRTQVNAQMPTPNPNYDPTKPQHDPTKTPPKKTKTAE
jgi:hypothetical protein